jgi:hypothetical protein
MASSAIFLEVGELAKFLSTYMAFLTFCLRGVETGAEAGGKTAGTQRDI